jgi:serine/threonine-protein kinase HipA
MLAATDGHGKNFSIFLRPRGRLRLTPLDGVLSIRPVLGQGRRCVHSRRARMAMATWGENRYDEWRKIQRRHFNAATKDWRLAGEPIRSFASSSSACRRQ